MSEYLKTTPGLDNSEHTQRAAPFSISTLWHQLITAWHYPVADRRDLRLDLLRGFATLVMVVDHLGGSSWLYLITGNNSFFTSGAEAFVLISGWVVGQRYRDILNREGFKSAALVALKRAFLLYRLTIVMTLSFAAVSVFFQLPWAKGIDLGDSLVFAFNVFILHETFYLADIPMMYAIFMALAPIGLWLLYRNRTGWLLLLSLFIWAGFQFVNAQQIMIWPTIGNTTFHPAAWQLFFMWAMAFGYHRQALETHLSRLPKLPYFALAAVLFLLLMDLYSPNVNVFDLIIPGFREQVLATQLFAKSTVAPGRILATLILFQFLYLLLTYFWKPIQSALSWFFLPLGQSSLYGYTMHVAVIAFFYIVLPYLPINLLEHGILNTGLQLGILLLLWGMTRRRFLFSIIPR